MREGLSTVWTGREEPTWEGWIGCHRKGAEGPACGLTMRLGTTVLQRGLQPGELDYPAQPEPGVFQARVTSKREIASKEPRCQSKCPAVGVMDRMAFLFFFLF